MVVTIVCVAVGNSSALINVECTLGQHVIVSCFFLSIFFSSILRPSDAACSKPVWDQSGRLSSLARPSHCQCL